MQSKKVRSVPGLLATIVDDKTQKTLQISVFGSLFFVGKDFQLTGIVMQSCKGL